MNPRCNTDVEASAKSPDSVTASDFCVLKTADRLERLCNYSCNHTELNVPSIHTPQVKRVTTAEIPKAVPPCPILRRRSKSISEGETLMKGRRAIFAQYWNSTRERGATNISLSRRTQLSQSFARKRSSSISILEAVATEDEQPADYRNYAPPKEHSSDICKRFAPVDALPALDLPPLPTPLIRLSPEGCRTGCLHGVYPLVSLPPILKQSSYRSLQCESGGPKHPVLSSDLPSFNMTQSYHFTNKDLSFASSSRSSSSISASEATPEEATKKYRKAVHFDPRITVTEFEDTVQRVWYDEFELTRFKYDTILLAQEYLMAHQHEAEKYSKAKLDPITGAFRKRALFSLPVLASTVDDTSALDGAGYSSLINKHIRNILVVDPNPNMLEIFRKSLKSIFPAAQIHVSQSAEHALRLASAQLRREYGSTAFQHRNFDIIIIEQSLSQIFRDLKPFKDQGRVKFPANNSCLNMSSMTEMDQPARIPKPSSFVGSEAACDSFCGIEMSGSDLIKAIHSLESDFFGSEKKHNFSYHRKSLGAQSNETAIPVTAKIFKWKSLLIGVSMQPDRDAAKLKEGGFDVIWGKPIPKISIALRDELVNSLLQKRGKGGLEFA